MNPDPADHEPINAAIVANMRHEAERLRDWFKSEPQRRLKPFDAMAGRIPETVLRDGERKAWGER